jgi:hypothetical protein
MMHHAVMVAPPRGVEFGNGWLQVCLACKQFDKQMA